MQARVIVLTVLRYGPSCEHDKNFCLEVVSVFLDYSFVKLSKVLAWNIPQKHWPNNRNNQVSICLNKGYNMFLTSIRTVKQKIKSSLQAKTKRWILCVILKWFPLESHIFEILLSLSKL